MSEELELAPTTAVNAAPDVMSALMELSPEIADEILDLACGIEKYKNLRIHRQRLFSLSLENEDQANVVSRFIDALIRFIKRFFKDIYEGSATLSFSLGKVHNRAELINTESRSRARTNRGTEFKIDTRVHNLCVNYRAVSDPQQLLMLLKSTDLIMKGYFKYQNVELPSVIPYLNSIRPENPTSVLSLVELLAPVSPMTKSSVMGFTGDNSVRFSQHLFGNQRLQVISKNSTGDAVEQLAGQEWLIQPSSDNPKPIPESITYKVFASTIEQSILREIIATTADLESNFGVISRNRRSVKVDDLTRYLERMLNDVINGKFTGEVLDRANQIVRLLEAYSNWLVNPYLNLMGLYIRNANAILNVCVANN